MLKSPSETHKRMFPVLMATTDPLTGERTQVGILLDALRSPTTAITIAAAYLIWLMGSSIVQSNAQIQKQIADHVVQTQTLGDRILQQNEMQRIQLTVLRKVCIGVNKAKPEICGDDK